MTQDIADIPLIAHIFQRQGWTWLDDPEPPDEAQIRAFIDSLRGCLLDGLASGVVAVHSGRILVRDVADVDGEAPDLEVFVNVSTPFDLDWPHAIGDGSADPA